MESQGRRAVLDPLKTAPQPAPLQPDHQCLRSRPATATCSPEPPRHPLPSSTSLQTKTRPSRRMMEHPRRSHQNYLGGVAVVTLVWMRIWLESWELMKVLPQSCVVSPTPSDTAVPTASSRLRAMSHPELAILEVSARQLVRLRRLDGPRRQLLKTMAMRMRSAAQCRLHPVTIRLS